MLVHMMGQRCRVQWSAPLVLVKLDKLDGGYLGLENALGSRYHSCSITATTGLGKSRLVAGGQGQDFKANGGLRRPPSSVWLWSLRLVRAGQVEMVTYIAAVEQADCT